MRSALAQVWKQRVEGEYAGGPSFYMDKGLKSKSAAVFYGLVSVVFFNYICRVQTNAFGTVVSTNFNISPIVIAILYTLLLVVVILGELRLSQMLRIKLFLLCLFYILP